MEEGEPASSLLSTLAIVLAREGRLVLNQRSDLREQPAATCGAISLLEAGTVRLADRGERGEQQGLVNLFKGGRALSGTDRTCPRISWP